jgi:exodeoxyribonuclease X
MIAIILDTETTEIKNPEVVELAWAEVEENPWRMYETNLFRFQNERPMQWGAIATHHILPNDLLGCPPSVDAKMPPCEYLIGHNIDFDWKALGSPPVKRICTMALSRWLYPECDSHSLSALLYYVMGANNGAKKLLKEAHSADADIMNCWIILKAMLEKANISGLEELYKLSEKARIPTVMPFGKHKGEPIASVPKSYRDWYRRQDETDPYILMAFSAK